MKQQENILVDFYLVNRLGELKVNRGAKPELFKMDRDRIDESEILASGFHPGQKRQLNWNVWESANNKRLQPNEKNEIIKNINRRARIKNKD